MKNIYLTTIIFLGSAAFAQDVQFDYDRSANFSVYKTYRWIDRVPVLPGDQLLDKDIKTAVDGQLTAKGLRRVDTGGDLHVSYQAGISREKELNNTGAGPLWLGDGHVTTSTIEIGKLVIELFDPASTQLVWRGAAAKTLNIEKDPEKNYRNLEKATAKLLKNYPPASGKR
jgi:hypothetical protein